MVKVKNNVVAVLDIGTTKIVCFIARHILGKMEVIGIGHQVSQGIRAGGITDIKQASACILAAVDAAEKMANETVERVVVNISDPQLRSRLVRVESPIHGREVVQKDITRIISQELEKKNHHDRKIVHCIPCDFAIDGTHGIKDPKGMFGKTLSAKLNIIDASTTSIINLSNCLARCHLDIDDYIVSPYASAIGCLTEDEKELGVTLLEMGGGGTSMAVFKGGKLLFTDTLPIGGNHVTNDIALGLTTNVASAERVKILYGNTLSSAADENKMIEIPRLGEEDENDTHTVSRATLVRIIRPRLEEIFEMVRDRLNESGMNEISNKRIVLTGGASQIMGLKELAAEIFERNIRLANPVMIEGLAESTRGAAFSTAVGMLHFTLQKMAPVKKQPTNDNAHHNNKGYVGKILHWVKENF